MADSPREIQKTFNREGWPNPVHEWLRAVNAAFAPGYTDPVLGQLQEGLREAFIRLGHRVADDPQKDTALIITGAPFGEALNWRSAKMFTARKEYGLDQTPVIITMLHATHRQMQDVLEKLSQALTPPEPEPALFDFPGLAPSAHRTLYEQGSRGGPVMALARLLQSQAKSIRILLTVGDDRPDYAYLFDLVGAHPKIHAGKPDYFFHDIALRMITAMSTREVTDHLVQPSPVPVEAWRNSSAPGEMRAAAAAFGKRTFFTEMVVVANLVHVPSISASVSDQYSEGCFATWAPDLGGLVSTITGSARPVEKDAITEDDLAVITGVRPDGSGAIVRHVEGKRNDSPSSESVEMMAMDLALPRIQLPPHWGIPQDVPVVRSKLHGHRGVSTYDPDLIEYTPLDPPYFTYPVSCATEAQAQAVVKAFSRAEALKNPGDRRQAVFTILPGHGLILVEKWVEGKTAFQHLWELMDCDAIGISNSIPQGPFDYRLGSNGKMTLMELPPKWLQQS